MIEVVLAGDAVHTPLWVDACAPDADELDALARDHGIPRAALEECTAPRHLPKHERLEGITFVIARVYDVEARPDADEYLAMTRKLSLFLGDRFLVTVHRRPLPFLERLKAATRASRKEVYLQVVLLEILLAGVETFYDPLEQAELEVHALEAKLLDPAPGPVDWRSVFRTKVRTQTMKRVLWHVQNASEKFVPRSAVNQPLAHDLRDRIASLSFLAEGLDDDLDNLLGIQLSLSANRTNEVVRVLTIFSAFFLPITFIVGVYGMNFRYMPELQQRWGYPVAWLVIAGTVIAIGAWFRKRGWLRWR